MTERSVDPANGLDSEASSPEGERRQRKSRRSLRFPTGVRAAEGNLSASADIDLDLPDLEQEPLLASRPATLESFTEVEI